MAAPSDPITVAASLELAGTWYVYVDGAASLEAADSIVAEMAQQLGRTTGETPNYHGITDLSQWVSFESQTDLTATRGLYADGLQ
ncbi:hypothetical protein GCM10022206_82560 [Streptomyces chiangmaiensis]